MHYQNIVLIRTSTRKTWATFNQEQNYSLYKYISFYMEIVHNRTLNKNYRNRRYSQTSPKPVTELTSRCSKISGYSQNLIALFCHLSTIPKTKTLSAINTISTNYTTWNRFSLSVTSLMTIPLFPHLFDISKYFFKIYLFIQDELHVLLKWSQWVFHFHGNVCHPLEIWKYFFKYIHSRWSPHAFKIKSVAFLATETVHYFFLAWIFTNLT